VSANPLLLLLHHGHAQCAIMLSLKGIPSRATSGSPLIDILILLFRLTFVVDN
jgi:hypothetical protein